MTKNARTRRPLLTWLCLPQGIQKRPLPLVLCLKVQYYLENGRLIWYVLHSSTVLDSPASILVLLSDIFCVPPPPLFFLPWYQRTKGTAPLLFWCEGAGPSLWVSSAGGGVLPAGRLRLAGWPRGPPADQGGHRDHNLFWTQTVLSSLGRCNSEEFKSAFMFSSKA